jgi:HTH-type transcriptional regulator / antitoxin HigA
MLKLINSKDEYDAALERIYNLMQLDLIKGSPEGDELELLSRLVHDYEQDNYPM